MTRRFLKETGTAGFRNLVVGQHQVHDSWDQIQAFLTSALGSEYAAIFAEPYRGQDGVTWMANADADPVPLGQLSPEDRAVATDRLQKLLSGIYELAEEKAASKALSDQQWGALLLEIQKFPQGPDLNDMMYVADGQPILVQWGMRDENAVVLTSVLAEEKKPVAQMIRRTPAPAGIVSSGPIAAAGFGWLWAWLLWLLFPLLLALIFWWLLLACSLGIPGAPKLFGNCAQPDRLTIAQARQDELTRELERLQTRASLAPQCAVRLAQRSPATPILPNRQATVVPDTARTEAPVPPSSPPIDPVAPNPVPEIASGETDFDRARERVDGQIGDVTVTLLWNGLSDLDLMIMCPGGTLLTKNVTQSANICGGEIDVDANHCAQREGGPGSACLEYKTEAVSNPVENGFFDASQAEQGLYQILVRHYASSETAPDVAVPFFIQLRTGENRERFDGSVMPGVNEPVTTFTVTE